ncbi:MAG: hypothetical protein AAGC78_10160 [Cellvibrio sp.]|uniref:hypothetical protein n=1 Tax=Cellvibrio sp. TaxID=1965322 RepID=UPI00319F0670
MKMLTIKNVVKLATGVISALVFSAQAFAGDIALSGSYGNYMQSDCAWNLSSSNTYGPNNVPSGATTNGVQVTIHYLMCAGNPAPQAVKTEVVNFTFTVPYWNIRTETSRSCSLSSAQATAVGNCVDHRVYN